jgi:hypothetical protein
MAVQHCAFRRQDRDCAVSFTVTDFNDFKQLLALHPEWQVELRRMIVGDDLEALPALVRDLVEAQRRSEGRLISVEERLTRLEEAVVRLAEAQERSENRLNRLEVAIEKLTEAVQLSEKRLTRLEERTGGMSGQLLEMRYRDRAAAYFGRWLRKTRVVDPSDLSDELEKHLSSEELIDAMEIDLVVRGRPRQRPDLEEIWLAVEISVVVDRDDVARAIKRADLIRRGGRQVLPVVAGKDFTEGAEFNASERKVLLLKNGSGQHWEEALGRWLK